MVRFGPRGSGFASEFIFTEAEDAVNTRNYDDWTIERWRLEPRHVLKFDDSLGADVEQAPPLWKDLTLASIVALVLWLAAAAVFG
jgi:hypothetical protein